MSIRESVLIIYYKNMKYDVGTFGCFFRQHEYSRGK